MKEIPLSQGQVALVDDEDYEWLNQWKWHASWGENSKTFYVHRNITRDNGKKTTISMHRVVMHAGKGERVDHEDHNGLNNQKHNLRFCTESQNRINRHGLRSHNTSGYNGVTWREDRGKWKSYIVVSGKQIFLGYYDSPHGAAIKYNEAAIKYHGEFAALNEIGEIDCDTETS